MDNNSSTRVDQRVLDVMLPWFREHWANPSSTRHKEGLLARAAIDRARSQVAEFVNCRPTEIVFTSGASEANALAILGAKPANLPPRCFVTTDTEHPSVLSLCRRACTADSSLAVVRVGGKGVATAQHFKGLPVDRNMLVSVQWANNETGIINEIEEIARMVSDQGALFHVDAVQALGKLEIDLSRIPIDLMTVSSHKMYGPKGAGALFVREGILLEPFQLGGHQESRLRAGTENVPGVVGFGEACALMAVEGNDDRARMLELRTRLENGLMRHCKGTIIIGRDVNRLPNTTLAAWEGLDNREILRDLDAKGICAGAGSACTSNLTSVSHVLRAMGVANQIAISTVRMTSGKENNEQEIDTVVQQLAETIDDLHRMV